MLISNFTFTAPNLAKAVKVIINHKKKPQKASPAEKTSGHIFCTEIKIKNFFAFF